MKYDPWEPSPATHFATTYLDAQGNEISEQQWRLNTLSATRVAEPTSSGALLGSSIPGMRLAEQPKIVLAHDANGKAYIAGYVDSDGRSITAEDFHRRSKLGEMRLVANHPILNREKPPAFQKYQQPLSEREKADAQRIAKTFARRVKG
jgi:hypothetical protein